MNIFLTKILYTVVCILFCPMVVWAHSVNRRNDVQLWEMQRLTWHVTPRTSLYFEEELRWGSNMSVLWHTHLQGGVVHAVRDWLEVGPGYRRFVVLRDNGTKDIVHQPLIDITGITKYRAWTIQDRSRLAYNVFADAPNQLLYRNRILCIAPWKWGFLACTPFFSNEFFFAERVGFFEHRFTIGGRLLLAQGIHSEIFYRLRYLKFPEPSEWRPAHILGLHFYFGY